MADTTENRIEQAVLIVQIAKDVESLKEKVTEGFRKIEENQGRLEGRVHAVEMSAVCADEYGAFKEKDFNELHKRVIVLEKYVFAGGVLLAALELALRFAF